MMVLMTCACLNEISGIWETYLKAVRLGVTTQSFAEWEDEYYSQLRAPDTLDKIARNQRRHLEKNDTMRRRLRKKLEEKRAKQKS